MSRPGSRIQSGGYTGNPCSCIQARICDLTETREISARRRRCCVAAPSSRTTPTGHRHHRAESLGRLPTLRPSPASMKMENKPSHPMVLTPFFRRSCDTSELQTGLLPCSVCRVFLPFCYSVAPASGLFLLSSKTRFPSASVIIAAARSDAPTTSNRSPFGKAISRGFNPKSHST